MNAHHDDNGAALVSYDEARVSIGQAWAAALCFGAAFWMVAGALVWRAL